MKTRRRTLWLCRTLGVLGAVQAATLRADLPLANETATLSDDFSGMVVGSIWSARTDSSALGYNTSAALVPGQTESGRTVLELTGQYDDTSRFPYECGGLVSNFPFPLGYGYYEVSAKLPLLNGWHCAFWLRGTNEIDAPEIDTGDEPFTAAKAKFNTHYWPPKTPTARISQVGWALDFLAPPTKTNPSRSQSAPVDLTAGYHSYGFEWSPTGVYYYVDRVRKAQTRYPGPHVAGATLLISLLAFNHNGIGVDLPAGGGPAVIYVDDFKYYRRNYGFPDWNSGTLNVALPAGDSTYSPSHNAVDPDSVFYTTGTPHVIASNDFSSQVHWDFPATSVAATGRYEVFVWNPSSFSPSFLSADIPAGPVDANTNPSGFFLDYTAGGRTKVIDSVYGGQAWRGLGACAFSGATSSAITMEAASTPSPNPLWTLRGGPAVFRPLGCYEEFSGGSLGSAWTVTAGTWNVSGGVAVTGGTGECILLRQASDGTIADGLVRALVTAPAIGGAKSAGLLARSSASGHYLLRLNYVSGKLGILKLVGGSYLTLADVTLPDDISLTDSLDLAFVLKNSGGNVDLLGFIDGRPIAAVTDIGPGSAYTGSGLAGVRAFGGAAQIDNFGVGL